MWVIYLKTESYYCKKDIIHEAVTCILIKIFCMASLLFGVVEFRDWASNHQTAVKLQCIFILFSSTSKCKPIPTLIDSCVFRFIYFHFMCAACFVCMCKSALCTWLVSTQVRVGFRAPVTRVGDNCETACGCWEPNPGLLQEQQEFLTTELPP